LRYEIGQLHRALGTCHQGRRLFDDGIRLRRTSSLNRSLKRYEGVTLPLDIPGFAPKGRCGQRQSLDNLTRSFSEGKDGSLSRTSFIGERQEMKLPRAVVDLLPRRRG
jgi:hypothetical protein